MKKTYLKPTLSIVKMDLEDSLLLNVSGNVQDSVDEAAASDYSGWAE